MLCRNHCSGTDTATPRSALPVLSKDARWKFTRSEQLEIADRCIIRVGGKEECDDDSSSGADADAQAAEGRPP